MNRPSSYNTKARQALLAYIASQGGDCVTAAQIVSHFEEGEEAIGRTTVYRLLDKLTQKGVLRRYTVDGMGGACYQYAGGGDDCHSHLHLKCEGCGALQHLNCDWLEDISRHLSDSHAFRVNTLTTVLYGKCGKCKDTRRESV